MNAIAKLTSMASRSRPKKQPKPTNSTIKHNNQIINKSNIKDANCKLYISIWDDNTNVYKPDYPLVFQN